jgi:hypothetical protein
LVSAVSADLETVEEALFSLIDLLAVDGVINSMNV